MTVPSMIRDGGEDSRIIILRLWTMIGIKVRRKLGGRGQKIWLSDRHADMEIFRWLWCYRHITMVHVETFRTSENGARARYISGAAYGG
jgi:hypothetical protein